MAKNKPSMPFQDDTTEHTGGDPIHSRYCQDLIDQAQIRGGGVSKFPEKVIVHHSPKADSVAHIYKDDK